MITTLIVCLLCFFTSCQRSYQTNEVTMQPPSIQEEEITPSYHPYTRPKVVQIQKEKESSAK